MCTSFASVDNEEIFYDVDPNGEKTRVYFDDDDNRIEPVKPGEVAQLQTDPKMKRGKRKRSTILTGPRGVSNDNGGQVKTLLGGS